MEGNVLYGMSMEKSIDIGVKLDFYLSDLICQKNV